jgi:hypothetical protein
VVPRHQHSCNPVACGCTGAASHRRGNRSRRCLSSQPCGAYQRRRCALLPQAQHLPAGAAKVRRMMDVGITAATARLFPKSGEAR